MVALQTDHRSSAIENPQSFIMIQRFRSDRGPLSRLDGALGAEGHVVDQNADEGSHHFSGHPRAVPRTLQRGRDGDERHGAAGKMTI